MPLATRLAAARSNTTPDARNIHGWEKEKGIHGGAVGKNPWQRGENLDGVKWRPP
jgi:hypothetical protein